MQVLPRDVRHLVLDRDGVLNEEAPGGYVTRPELWRWLPRSLQALTLLSRAGMRISVATNQSAVGRGLMTLDDLDEVHAHMLRECTAAGGRIDSVFACVHAPWEGCRCRKPAPGLIEAALAATTVPAAQTLMVGDAARDLEAARAAGIQAVLLTAGHGASAAAVTCHDTDVVKFDDLYELARALVATAPNGDAVDPSGQLR